MGLGGKMHHGIDTVFGQDACHQGCIADIPLDETVTGVIFDRRQIFEIAGIGQAIQIYDVAGGVIGDKRVDEVGTDEACAAGYQNGCGRKCHKSRRILV